MSKGLLALLLLCVVGVKCGVLSGKALFCRDPDTGKLHSVNTTWTATSFCGNYTCHLRKRNETHAISHSFPIRKFNVTNINDTQSTTEQIPMITIEKKTEPEIQTLLHKNVIPYHKNMIEKVDKTVTESNNFGPNKYFDAHEKSKVKYHKCKMHKEELNSPIVTSDSSKDRFLTEQEIDKIAGMLHTIKKSDLDAVVDIYNLAKDIYKEIDDITDDEIKKEALNLLKEEEKHRNKINKPVSYWYDSAANKGRIVEKDEMEIQNTYDVYSTMKPMVGQTVPSIYSGPVQSNEIIEKVPYYYPVTQFQRISSYTHPALKVNTPKYVEAKYDKYFAQRMVPETILPNSRKLIQPSLYLPYPFANIHPNNTTDARNFYYASPWMLDYYNNYYNKYYQPYYNGYVAPMPKPVQDVPVFTNPQISIEAQNVEPAAVKRLISKEKEADMEVDIIDTLLKGQKTPIWKTDPIPLDVLKDIKADIDTSRLLKAFPLRKKIKLEKVGKVINVGDLVSEVNRNKRFVAELVETNSSEVGEFETVLERVTCNDQTELGYFRMGNMTQPYPECCPQLIDAR